MVNGYCHLTYLLELVWMSIRVARKDKELTEHHAKEIGKKIMVCMERYNVCN
jgi:hypothetical protein